MKRLVPLLSLLICLNAHGQKTVRLLDSQTKNPVVEAVVADSVQTFGFTDKKGSITLEPNPGKIIFAHEHYDRVAIPYDELPDTILMERRTYNIDEVEVIGHAPLQISPEIFKVYKNKTEQELATMDYSGGINLLGPIVYIASKLIKPKKKHKETRRERLERILEDATP